MWRRGAFWRTTNKCARCRQPNWPRSWRGSTWRWVWLRLPRTAALPATPALTLELALVLGQTRNNGDLARALALLDPLARSGAPELQAWQPLARLLAARYLEQRRLEDQLERQVLMLRDSQRRLDQVNDKLEALKNIERSLTVRPPGNAPAAPPRAP